MTARLSPDGRAVLLPAYQVLPFLRGVFMSNMLDNAVVLDASAAATPSGTAGAGPVLWKTLGVTKMGLFTGTNAPVNADPTWAAAGLTGASRAFYLRETGTTAGTMLYFTLDGGATWTAGAL